MATVSALSVAGFVVGGVAIAVEAWRMMRSRSVGADRYLQQGLVGVVGGLGPKASAVWYDENVIGGRVALFQAMQRAVERDGNDGASMVKEVRQVSSAEWTEEDLVAVWEGRVGKDKIRDQDHVSLLLYSNPTIPGRPEFMSGASPDDPTPSMAATAKALVEGGASALCMVCSTAHYFKDGMLKNISVPFLNMVDLSLEHVMRSVNAADDGSVVVGLLGTEPLLRFKVYENACESLFPPEAGRTVVMHTPLSVPGGAQDSFNEAIFGNYGIKAGYDHDLTCAHTKRNFDLLAEQVAILHKAGAKAIILGCTELPLLLTEERVAEYLGERILLVNPAQVLADEVIRYSLISRK
mmetsp:Transcript_24055/g.42457  ORF Transcript_24055/g.42457 Transcript_24055/m.42457 type:complete len:352 (-) Transcript_24055:71-1126(-)